MKSRKNPRSKGALEIQLQNAGEVFAGVDEVGRGSLAGPVYAAAVVLDMTKLRQLGRKAALLIRDSKTLSASQRGLAEEYIMGVAVDFAVGSASVEEIDQINILQASLLAMRRCIDRLKFPIDRILVDGNQKIPDIDKPQMSLVGGDGLCYSIAAASILAKNARDKMMAKAAEVYPQYGFERHVGYATALHLQALEQFGICPLHRKTFAPILARGLGEASMLNNWSATSSGNMVGVS